MPGLILAFIHTQALRGDDLLQNFSWVKYAFWGAFYTILGLLGLVKMSEVRLIFSRQNARPLSAILVIHAVFLAILLGVMQNAAYIAPFLPNWMLEQSQSRRGRGSTFFGFLFVLTLVALLVIERRWIYVPNKALSSIDENSRSSSSISERN